MKNVSARVDVVMAESAPVPTPVEADQEPAETVDVAVEEQHTEQEHTHKPVQHRDGKERWCNVCGLTADGRTPEDRLLPAGQE